MTDTPQSASGGGAGVNAAGDDVVITYLEMTAPPRGRPPEPAGAPLAILRATTPPTHFFLYLYRTVGAAYHWVDLLDLSEEALRAFVQDPEVELYVLYRGGAPAGFYQLDFRTKQICNLAYFGLMPEATGLRLGPWLLHAAQREAWARGIARMTVNTCTLDHPSALRTYQRAGFAPVRRDVKPR